MHSAGKQASVPDPSARMLNSPSMDTAKSPHSAETIASTRAELVAQASSYAAEYLAGVDARPVAPSPEAVAGLAALCGELPTEAANPQIVLELLHRHGSPATVVNSGGRYFGFVIGGAAPAALAAEMAPTMTT